MNNTPAAREGSLEAPIRHPVDWQNPLFWDAAALEAEMRRVFDICHGCRRCFNLCDSFPRLFDLIDQSPNEDLADVPAADFGKVVDACTLCDLCFMTKCPYVPPHEFNLDFPHLMLRARAIEARQKGVPLPDQVLGAIDVNGTLGGMAAPLANWATATSNQPVRQLLAKTLGVDPRAALPRFHGQTLQRQAGQNPPAVNTNAPAYSKRQAVLFATCFGNYHNPTVGRAALAILAHNGIAAPVVYPGCCGMPQLEQGQIADVVTKAKRAAHAFAPHIAAGNTVLALVPSCALMLKFEWPLLVPKTDPDYPLVQQLAAATRDISEYIVDIAKREGLAPGLRPIAGRVALHIACHARAQNIGPKAAELLRLIPDMGPQQLQVIERCSGHGGSWGVKEDNFALALKVGKPVARAAAQHTAGTGEVAAAAPGIISSECPLAGMHIGQGIEALEPTAAARRQLHPIEIFAMAYGLLEEGT